MKGYIQYFENLDYYKKQKRKEFLTNVLEFIGMYVMIKDTNNQFLIVIHLTNIKN